MFDRPRKCSCGSGKVSRWVKDYQGIELARVCEDCEKERLAHFAPEIFSGYDQSDVDEPIEPDPADHWDPEMAWPDHW
jgi:hypothetical protein